ncbi:MAG: hypothetical protein AUK50_00630 [Comamonadaceae bacterium CG2_30_57_122]|nr:MAG: hypothetical protein AUK50_00630 [Comamonadaceae bacterium CG2_30_57_122]
MIEPQGISLGLNHTGDSRDDAFPFAGAQQARGNDRATGLEAALSRTCKWYFPTGKHEYCWMALEGMSKNLCALDT